MVQEGEDGGWAKAGAGVRAAAEEWLVLEIFSGVQFPLLTFHLFLGPSVLWGSCVFFSPVLPTRPAPSAWGVEPDELLWHSNFDPEISDQAPLCQFPPRGESCLPSRLSPAAVHTAGLLADNRERQFAIAEK